PSQTTIYTLTASNSAGSTTARVTVTVNATPPTGAAPVILSFSANPSTVVAGQVSTLSWSTTGDTSLTIDNGVGWVSGWTRTFVRPAQTTTYTLTASNAAGSTKATVTVTVGNSSGT